MKITKILKDTSEISIANQIPSKTETRLEHNAATIDVDGGVGLEPRRSSEI